MIPAAAEFTVNEDWSDLGLGCPLCDDDGRGIVIPYGSTIRELIAAASNHAATHTMSEAGIRP